jgi:hypothetical protein
MRGRNLRAQRVTAAHGAAQAECTRFIECNVAVVTDSSEEKFDAAVGLYALLVTATRSTGLERSQNKWSNTACTLPLAHRILHFQRSRLRCAPGLDFSSDSHEPSNAGRRRDN